MKVLLIEDNDLEAKVMEYILDQADIDFVRYKNVFVPGNDESDICLLGLNLDNNEYEKQTIGSETIKKFRDRHPLMPIIVLTSSTDLKTREFFMQMGADSHLVKGQASAESIIRSMELAIMSSRDRDNAESQDRLDEITDDLQKILKRLK